MFQFYFIFCVVFIGTKAEETLAHTAARTDNVQNLKTSVVNDGKDVNELGNGGQTPLMAACLAGSLNAMKWLLDYGADKTIGEKDGYTCLHGIGFQGRAELAKAFLQDYGLKDTLHRDGFYAFHRACWGRDGRHAKTVEAFLHAGIDPDFKAQNGKTCAEMTSNSKTKKIIKTFKKKFKRIKREKVDL